MYSDLGDFVSLLYEKNPDAKFIVDLGAYDGGDSIALSSFFPLASIMSVEASPLRFPIVVKNCSPYQNIRVIHAAVSDCQKEVVLTHSWTDKEPHCAMLSGLKPDYDLPKGWRIDQRRWTMKSVSLYELCQKEFHDFQVDILHMDVEGSELNVLKGMGTIRPRIISMEVVGGLYFNGAATRDELCSFVSGYGYSPIVDRGHDMIFWRDQ